MSELAKWANFYVIVGSAAGALIGLQFVVLTLIANRPHMASAEAGAAFGSPTVVHLGSALFLSAIMHVPWPAIGFAGTAWAIFGFGGLVYSLIVLRRMVRQSAYNPELEDWLFHCFLPLVAYAALAAGGCIANFHTRAALFTVGGAVSLLLFIGIHNAWDGVSYHVLVTMANAERQRREDESRAQRKEPE